MPLCTAGDEMCFCLGHMGPMYWIDLAVRQSGEGRKAKWKKQDIELKVRVEARAATVEVQEQLDLLDLSVPALMDGMIKEYPAGRYSFDRVTVEHLLLCEFYVLPGTTIGMEARAFQHLLDSTGKKQLAAA